MFIISRSPLRLLSQFIASICLRLFCFDALSLFSAFPCYILPISFSFSVHFGLSSVSSTPMTSSSFFVDPPTTKSTSFCSLPSFSLFSSSSYSSNYWNSNQLLPSQTSQDVVDLPEPSVASISDVRRRSSDCTNDSEWNPAPPSFSERLARRSSNDNAHDDLWWTNDDAIPSRWRRSRIGRLHGSRIDVFCVGHLR